jgi:hypothetical protein
MRRWPQPDFVSRPSQTSVLAWWCAATGLIVLALTSGDLLAVRADAAEHSARLAKASQRIAAMKPSAAAAARPSGPPDDAALRSAVQMASRLDHRWGELLAAVEASTPEGVQWLRFEHDSERPELRLEGQASDVAPVLQAVAELSARVGWSDVVLVRLQADDAHDAAGGRAGLRFEIAARVAAGSRGSL